MQFASLTGFQAVFLGFLLTRFNLADFFLTALFAGFLYKKLLLLLGWFLLGFFLRCHGNLL